MAEEGEEYDIPEEEAEETIEEELEEHQEEAEKTIDEEQEIPEAEPAETSETEGAETIGEEQESSQAVVAETIDKDQEASQDEAAETIGVEQDTTETDTIDEEQVSHQGEATETINEEQEVSQETTSDTVNVEHEAPDADTTETVSVEQETSESEVVNAVGEEGETVKAEAEDTADEEDDCDEEEAEEDVAEEQTEDTAGDEDSPALMDFFDMQQPDTDILWFDVLPNDQLILLSNDCDPNIYIMSQLRLYSSESADTCTSRRMLSKLKVFDSVPPDTLNDHQVIVATSNDHKVQIVNIQHGKLIKDRVIKVHTSDTNLQLVQKYSDSSVIILAWRHDRNVKHCFQIIDMFGSVQKHIDVKTDLTHALRMKLNADRREIYTVCVGHNSKGVNGFNLNGDKIFHYTHQDCKFYRGFALDPDGALYVSPGGIQEGPTSVIKLSPAGQLLQQIDIKGKIPINCIGNKLYLVGFEDPSVIKCIFV